MIGETEIKLTKTRSTNDFAEDLCIQGEAQEGTVVLTSFQEKGKGQIGKSWYSSPGKNLLCSIILEPTFLPIKSQFYLSMAISLAVRELVSIYCSHAKVSVKWPNDIYCEGYKLAGILIQTILQGSKMRYAIVGIGLNINEKDFPNKVPNPTTLRIETGNEQNIDSVKKLLYQCISESYSMLKAGMYKQLRDLYLKHLYLRDTPSYFSKNGNTFKGTIKGITDTGQLIIDQEGSEYTYANNEIAYIKM